MGLFCFLFSILIFKRQSSGMDTLIIAVGLLLIFEGMGPALFPKAWKEAISHVAQQPEKQLKTLGSGLIIVGAIIVLLMLN